ncbi:condensation protein, partial [Streptomyces prasinus]
MTAPLRIPFPVVDEVSRHCVQEEEPETVLIEVHLPGELDAGRLRKAFLEALRRHPRILMREAPGPWYRRRYEWELTDEPDVEAVSFASPGPASLREARARAMAVAPPLTASPPIRLEVVPAPGETESGAGGGGGGGAAPGARAPPARAT